MFYIWIIWPTLAWSPDHPRPRVGAGVAEMRESCSCPHSGISCASRPMEKTQLIMENSVGRIRIQWDQNGSAWSGSYSIYTYRPFIIRAYCTVHCTVNQGGFGSAPNILRIRNLVYIDTYSIRKKNRARRKKRCLTRIILTFFLNNILPSFQKWCTQDT